MVASQSRGSISWERQAEILLMQANKSGTPSYPSEEWRFVAGGTGKLGVVTSQESSRDFRQRRTGLLFGLEKDLKNEKSFGWEKIGGKKIARKLTAH